MRLPRSLRNSRPALLIVPRVSTATGMKVYDCASCPYMKLAIFLSAAASAVVPGDPDYHYYYYYYYSQEIPSIEGHSYLRRRTQYSVYIVVNYACVPIPVCFSFFLSFFVHTWLCMYVCFLSVSLSLWGVKPYLTYLSVCLVSCLFCFLLWKIKYLSIYLPRRHSDLAKYSSKSSAASSHGTRQFEEFFR